MLATTFFLALGSVIHANRTLAFDLRVHHVIHGDTDQWFTPYFVIGPAIATASLVVIPLTALWLLQQKQRRVAALIFISQIAGIVATILTKSIYQRVRPGDDPGIFSFLFPSTHTVMTVLAYGLLAYLIAQRVDNQRRALVVCGVIALFAFIFFSLVYLDDHYCTDVVGGVLLSTGWLSLTICGLRVMTNWEHDAHRRQTAVIPAREIVRR